MITHKQLSLAEIFEDCQNKFDNDKYQFLPIFKVSTTLNKMRPDMFLCLRKSVFLLAKFNAFHKEGHISGKYPHCLFAFLIHFCLSFFTTMNAVPVLAGCDRHIADCEEFV